MGVYNLVYHFIFHSKMGRMIGMKSEARNTKLETNSNSKIQMFETFLISIFEIRIFCSIWAGKRGGCLHRAKRDDVV